jgi:hypothetical protein
MRTFTTTPAWAATRPSAVLKFEQQSKIHQNKKNQTEDIAA